MKTEFLKPKTIVDYDREVLIVNLENEQIENTILSFVKEKCKKYIVKSKTVSNNGIEFSLEVRLNDMST